MTLSILSKTKPVKTMNSVANDFPILDVDEFDGWVDLEALDHLVVVGHSDGVRIIRSHFQTAVLTLCVLKQASTYFHTSTARTT